MKKKDRSTDWREVHRLRAWELHQKNWLSGKAAVAVRSVAGTAPAESRPIPGVSSPSKFGFHIVPGGLAYVANPNGPEATALH